MQNSQTREYPRTCQECGTRWYPDTFDKWEAGPYDKCPRCTLVSFHVLACELVELVGTAEQKRKNDREMNDHIGFEEPHKKFWAEIVAQVAKLKETMG